MSKRHLQQLFVILMIGIYLVFPVSAESLKNSTSVKGASGIQVESKNIMNVLSNSHGSSVVTQIGYVRQSDIQSIDAKIRAGNVTNSIEGATDSSSSINMGSVTQTKVGKARIDVDVKNVESKVRGGKNNHATINVGALKDSHIGGNATIEVHARSLSNIIHGGSNNEAEISIGYDPSATEREYNRVLPNANNSREIVKDDSIPTLDDILPRDLLVIHQKYRSRQVDKNAFGENLLVPANPIVTGVKYLFYSPNVGNDTPRYEMIDKNKNRKYTLQYLGDIQPILKEIHIEDISKTSDSQRSWRFEVENRNILYSFDNEKGKRERVKVGEFDKNGLINFRPHFSTRRVPAR